MRKHHNYFIDLENNVLCRISDALGMEAINAGTQRHHIVDWWSAIATNMDYDVGGGYTALNYKLQIYKAWVKAGNRDDCFHAE